MLPSNLASNPHKARNVYQNQFIANLGGDLDQEDMPGQGKWTPEEDNMYAK